MAIITQISILTSASSEKSPQYPKGEFMIQISQLVILHISNIQNGIYFEWKYCLKHISLLFLRNIRVQRLRRNIIQLDRNPHQLLQNGIIDTHKHCV